MRADLHTHSNASDGTLTPLELVTAAQDAGITMLSITDHDTVAAYKDLTLGSSDIEILPGIELSSRWRKIGIHIVGLNIDPDSKAITEICRHQNGLRQARAVVIAERLEKLGYTDTLQGATDMAAGSVIGRPHFARYLVESGQIKNEQLAFRKLLGQGKPGDVRDNWPEPEQVISSIRAAGGTAVLAHPMKYKLSNLKLEELTRDFAAAGGEALEIVSGKQQATLTHRLSKLATRYSLAVSCGSDFHRPGQSWAELGRIPDLPDGGCPVWDLWQNQQPDSISRQSSIPAAES